jgi:hypothetical protein
LKKRWIKVGEVGCPSANLLIADPLEVSTPGHLPPVEEQVGLVVSPWVEVARWHRAKPKDMSEWSVLQISEKHSGKHTHAAIVVHTLEADFDVYARIVKDGDFERVAEIKVVFEGDEEDEFDDEITPSQVDEALAREKRLRGQSVGKKS